MEANLATSFSATAREPQGRIKSDEALENTLRRRSTSIAQFAFDFDAAEVGMDDLPIAPKSDSEDSDQNFPRVLEDTLTLAPSETLDLPLSQAPSAKIPNSIERSYSADAPQETIVMLQALERKMISEGRLLCRQRTREDRVSLPALASELKVGVNRFYLPGVPDAIKAMARRVGIEPPKERPYVTAMLKSVDELADRLRKGGGKMPWNSLAPQDPNWAKVRCLLGCRPGIKLPEAVKDRVTALYTELGIESPPLAIAEVRLREWGERAGAEGLRIPACAAKPNETYIPAFAQMLGMLVDDLYNNRAVLAELGDKLGYEIVKTARELMPVPTLVLTEAWVAKGGKVPQHPDYPGRPWFAAACDQIGIHPKALSTHGAVRDAIIDAGRTVGFETVIHSVAPEAVLLRELKEKAIEMRRDEVRGSKAESAQIANLKSRLNQLAALDPDGESAHARDVLDKAAKEKPGDSKFHGEMRVLRRCLEQIELSHELPRDFAAALRELCRRAKVSFKAVSREAGLAELTVYRWVTFGAPAPNRRADVELVERVLKATPMTLVSRMVSVARKQRVVPLWRFPEPLQTNKVLRGRVVARLSPTDFALSDANFLLRCEAILEEIKNNTKPLTAFVRATDHAIDQLPKTVEDQFSAICMVAQLDGPQRREAMGRFDFYDENLRWSGPTMDGHLRTLRSFFGFLSRDADGRAAVARADMTLALMLVPKLALDYATWLPSLRKPGASGRLVSQSDAAPARLFSILLRPNGIIRRMPEIARSLRPVPGYLDGDRIGWIQANWEAACHEAYERFRSICSSYFEHEFERSAEIASLLPILNLPDPSYAVTRCILHHMRDARAHMGEGNLRWALAVRNEMYVHVQDQMAFREGTLRQIGPGHFRLAGNGIQLHLPRQFFKNRSSKRVWRPGRHWINFERDLDDKLGAHAVYDLYVNQARPLLIGSNSDPGTFFVNEDGSSKQLFSYLATDLSKQFLIDRADASPFWKAQRLIRNHDFRHILATSIIRRTGDLQAAADALMDTIDTVRDNYAFVRAEDRNARLRQIMQGRGAPPGLQPTT